MRRALRKFATGAAGMSLLLCVVCLVMWARSYWKSDWRSRFLYSVQTHEYRPQVVGCESGKVVAILWNYRIDDSFVEQMEARAAGGEFSDRWERGTFGVLWPAQQQWWERVVSVQMYRDGRKFAPSVGRGVMVVVPHWVLVAGFSVWPAVWGLAWWKKKRRLDQGRCENCGYDLRASPERCPECGAAAVGEAGR